MVEGLHSIPMKARTLPAELTIGEVAQLTGLPVKRIHYYERRGLLEPAFVPQDNFYRRLEAAALDLSFVRELVRPLYARGGRPSVDPVVSSSFSW
jgi:hypothetical protein